MFTIRGTGVAIVFTAAVLLAQGPPQGTRLTPGRCLSGSCSATGD